MCLNLPFYEAFGTYYSSPKNPIINLTAYAINLNCPAFLPGALPKAHDIWQSCRQSVCWKMSGNLARSELDRTLAKSNQIGLDFGFWPELVWLNLATFGSNMDIGSNLKYDFNALNPSGLGSDSTFVQLRFNHIRLHFWSLTANMNLMTFQSWAMYQLLQPSAGSAYLLTSNC